MEIFASAVKVGGFKNLLAGRVDWMVEELLTWGMFIKICLSSGQVWETF